MSHRVLLQKSTLLSNGAAGALFSHTVTKWLADRQAALKSQILAHHLSRDSCGCEILNSLCTGLPEYRTVSMTHVVSVWLAAYRKVKTPALFKARMCKRVPNSSSAATYLTIQLLSAERSFHFTDGLLLCYMFIKHIAQKITTGDLKT